MTAAVVAALGGYAVGCACSGYYLVRLVAGDDIRRSGSGGAGATNVGRRLGPLAFAATFVLDCVKGMAVAWAARHYELGDVAASCAVVAVVAGHIWPAQLGCRGGKGIATSLGAFAVYDSRIVLVIAALFAFWFMVSRAFRTSGLLSYLLAPLVLVPQGLPVDRLVTLTIVSTAILAAHRDYIRAALGAAREPAAWQAAEKGQPDG